MVLASVALMAGMCLWSVAQSVAGAAVQVPKLTHLWSATLAAPGTAPVIDNGEVFVAASTSELYAFDATCAPAPAPCTKDLLWQQTFPSIVEAGTREFANLSPAGVGGGNVYVGWNQYTYAGDYGGSEQAFAEATGAPVFSNGQGGTAAPVVTGGLVYSNWQTRCCDGISFEGTEALNATTGTEVFDTYPAGDTSAPAVSSGTLFVAVGTLYAYDASGDICTPPPGMPFLNPYYTNLGFPEVCAPLWSGATAGTVTGTPVIADGEVYVGDSDGVLYAFPAAGCGSATCAPDWTATAGGPITSVAVSDTTVFVASSDGTLYAYPLGGCGSATCTAEWTATIGGSLSSPTVDGSWVYVGSTNHDLDVFPAAGCGKATCGPAAYVKVQGPITTAPAVSGGLIFVTDARVLQVYELPADQVPTITSSSSKTAHVDSPFSFTVKTKGFPTASITEIGTLPGEVTFTDNGNGTATLGGTPATGSAGTYPITMTASNLAGSDSQSFSLVVKT